MGRNFGAVAVVVLVAIATPAQSQAPTVGHALAAERLAAQYVGLAGSEENALALVMALRTGEPVKLAFPAEGGLLAVQLLEPPTGAMSWGDVASALHLVQRRFERAGVARPNGEQLEGVLAWLLRLRADGLDWIDVASASASSTGNVLHPVAARHADGGAHADTH